MSRRPDRTIALVPLNDPEELAERLASAMGGKARALVLLRAAVAYIEGVRDVSH